MLRKEQARTRTFETRIASLESQSAEYRAQVASAITQHQAPSASETSDHAEKTECIDSEGLAVGQRPDAAPRENQCFRLRRRDQKPLRALGGLLVHRQAVTSRLTSLLI